MLAEKILKGPEICKDYSPGYYAFFFEDPDGNKLEICCREKPVFADRAVGAATSSAIGSAIDPKPGGAARAPVGRVTPCAPLFEES